MDTLIIASLRSSVGKTSVIIGLAVAARKKIGYMKPFGDRLLYSKKRLWDYDAALITHIYNLEEDPDTLSIGFDHSKLRYMYTKESIKEKVIEMATRMGDGKDLLIVEGGKSISYGHSVNLDSLSLARYLKGRLLFVISGDDDTILDDIMFVKENVDLSGITFAGIIVNKVQNLDDFQERFMPEMSRAGINVAGVIPFEKELTYFTLRYLADRLFAKVLTAEGNLDRTIKNIFIGAMSGNVAKNKPLFKKEAKLIITGGDRSDMILAALEKDAAGIILTNNILPPSQIIAQAEERGTPMLLVTPDTYQVERQIEHLEPLLTKDDTHKIELMQRLVSSHVNLSALGIVEG